MKKKHWAAAGAVILAYAGVALGGTNTWTDTGPEASDVKVKFSSSPDIAYARGGDKLWKSTDAGLSWVTLFSKNASYYPFALDPTDPDILMVGTGFFGDGILRSINGGASFTNVAFGYWYALEFAADATVAYGVTYNVNPQISRSVDKGATWTPAASAGLPTVPGASTMVPLPYSLGVDRQSANTVYAGLRHPDYQGIYRSLDGGDTWTPASGLAGITVNAISPHPTVSGRVFIATSVGVFRSDDTGATWNRVADPSTTGVATLDMQSVAFDRTDPQMIYAGGAQRGEIFFSADGGLTWTRRDTGVIANKINMFAPRPGHAGELLVGTSHTMYRSTNAGQAWAVSANGIRAANVTSVQNGSRLRVGLADGGIYESTDGSSWTPLNNEALRARLPGGKFSNIVEILEGDRLFIMPFDSGLLTSTTEGATWEPVSPSYPSFMLYHFGGLMTQSGTGPVHFAGTNSGIYMTPDNGVSWFPSGSGLPATTIRDFTKNGDASALYAATFNQGVYKSTDSGANWTAVNSGLTNLEIKHLEYDTGNDVLLVGTNNGLFASTNGGAGYTQLTNPWPAAQMSVDGIVVEDFVRGALYVGFQKKVFRSVDSGLTWSELAEGNPYSDSVIRITSMISDGPGVLYLGNMASGLQTYTVSPDIQVSASSLPAGPYPIGAVLPWQFVVTNAGTHAATFTQAGWQVPANVDVVNLASSRGTCSVSVARRLSCDFGVLPAGQSATVTLSLRGTAGGTLGLNLSAGAAEIDPVPDNNIATDSGVRFVEEVDLAAALTLTPVLVNSGSPFEYTLVVTNNGPNAASGGSFETTFDARDQYTLAQGSAAGCTGSVAGILVCPLPILASGASATWRWTVTPQWGGARTPGVIVRVDVQNSLDSNPVNNTATATGNVVPVTDLSTSLTSAVPNLLQGAPLALTATVTNHSVIDAAGVTSTLTLGDRLAFVSASGATCTSTGNVVGCAIGALGAGTSRAVIVNVTAISPGVTTSTFSAASVGPDPTAANNSSSVAVTVDPANDLSITLTGAAGAVTGSAVVLTLTGSNLSATEAVGVRADVTLSALVTYVSATGATCTIAAAVLSCDLGAISGNGSKAVSITVNAVTAGIATMAATITGASSDPDTVNNAASAQTTITPPPPPPSSGGSSSGGGGGGGAFDPASVVALLGILSLARSRRRAPLRRAA